MEEGVVVFVRVDSLVAGRVDSGVLCSMGWEGREVEATIVREGSSGGKGAVAVMRRVGVSGGSGE